MSDPEGGTAAGEGSYNAIRRLFAAVDPAVWLISAYDGNRRNALIATFVSQASIVPRMPRLLVGIATQHYTWELIRRSGTFAAMLLEDGQWPLVGRFGLRSGRDGDKFAGMDVAVHDERYLVLPGVCGWAGCVVEASFDIGDRTLFLGSVECSEGGHGTPLRMSAWWARATPDHAKLKAQLERDARRDAAAIAAWRQARGWQSGGPPPAET